MTPTEPPHLLPNAESAWRINPDSPRDDGIALDVVPDLPQNRTQVFASCTESEAPSATGTILLCTTLRWPFAARLAMAFDSLGCVVEAYCPRQHAMEITSAVRRTHRHSAFRPLASLRAAIAQANPDLVVPCDDEMARQLARLHHWAQGHQKPQLEALLTRSLGSPQACNLAAARGELLNLAAALGLTTPPTVVIDTEQELKFWLQKHPYPAVLKSDATYGGQGVLVIRTWSEAACAWRCLTQRPTLRRSLWRVLLDRNWTTFLKWWQWPGAPTITVQPFISGRPANCAIACQSGRVLAILCVEALQTLRATGPASVIRVVQNPTMEEAAGRIAKSLNLSGLWGFDFIIDAQSGECVLIEANPRATPICHLPYGAGRDLPAALLHLLHPTVPSASRTALSGGLVALFPDEWQRDHRSAYLGKAIHDVPWNEPDLVRDCMDRPWAERGLAARLWRWVKPRTARHLPEGNPTPNDVHELARRRSLLGTITNRSQPSAGAESLHE